MRHYGHLKQQEEEKHEGVMTDRKLPLTFTIMLNAKRALQ